MDLPKKLKVGDRWYSVEIVETMQRRAQMGCVYYGTGEIEVAVKSNTTNKPYTKAEVSDTFWHELTHAILYDRVAPCTGTRSLCRALPAACLGQSPPQNSNEKDHLVTQLPQRL